MEVKRLQQIEGFVLLLLVALEVFVLTKFWDIGAVFIVSGVLAFFFLAYFSLVINLQCIVSRLRKVLFKMDPEMLRREIDQYFQSEKQRNSSLYYLFESARLDLLGEYQKALECSLKKKFKQPKMQLAVNAGLCYYYARLGDMAAAESYLPFCEELLKTAKGKVKASCLHTMGYYCLIKRDYLASRRYFNETIQMDKTNYTLLNTCFDLACLEEIEGNNDKAIELFKKTAALGPKTWMGQKAARKLYARGIKLNDSVYTDFLMRQSIHK